MKEIYLNWGIKDIIIIAFALFVLYIIYMLIWWAISNWQYKYQKGEDIKYMKAEKKEQRNNDSHKHKLQCPKKVLWINYD